MVEQETQDKLQAHILTALNTKECIENSASLEAEMKLSRAEVY
jgi:hypothetical protein